MMETHPFVGALLAADPFQLAIEKPLHLVEERERRAGELAAYHPP